MAGVEEDHARLRNVAAERLGAVVEQDFAQVEACEGHGCTLLFSDHTRRRTRRWCSMSVRGNRAKVSAHRNGRKEAAS
ncbi:CGNR zinc finger domain-containing protein [Sphingomonas sp. ZT3P38]|uniref:CGNR zinc finger domain-containing protein n=1 Tax=Parasphingomonas zepuensis TaxID=3096161 RepID=UPI003FA6EB88